MNRFLILGIIVVVGASIACNVFLFLTRPHIAYVRSYDLIEKFEGTQAARAKFEQKKSAMLANVDSLKAMFEKERIAYVSNLVNMTMAQRAAREEYLGQQQNQIIQYSNAVEDQLTQEDKDMMTPVLSQINTYVKEYAETKGIDMILGTTLSGSLLYGKSPMDVTDDILSNLNAKYKGY
jgi:outer membrane protein